MAPDGSDLTVIADLGRNIWHHDLAWTPEGERILFASEVDPNLRRQRLNVIDRDGSNLTLLHEYDFFSRDVNNPVAFSPDGTEVAYFTWSFDPFNGDWTIGLAISDIDGSDRRVVLKDAGGCCDDDVFWYPHLAWSPDGTALALTIDGPGEQPRGS
jgi:Tol biopolymer transport system component